MDAIPSQGSSESIIFALTAAPVTKPMTSDIIPAGAKSVPLVTKQDVPTFHRTNSRVTIVLNVTATSSENSVWAIITSTAPPTERKPTKRSKMCVAPIASVPTVTDYSDLGRSKRDTCAAPPNVPRAKSITISTVTNVTSRIPPNWNKRKNDPSPENARPMVHKPLKPKTTSSSIGTMRPCKTQASMYPIWYALPPPTATTSFISKGPRAFEISSIG